MEVVVVVASLVVKQGVAQAALKCMIVSVSELIHSFFLRVLFHSHASHWKLD